MLTYNPFTGQQKPPEKPSLFWRALDLLNRPYSATTGAITAVLQGDPLSAPSRARKGFMGEENYGGADMIETLGGDPTSTLGRIGSTAYDFLGPDPVNLIGGLGVLSKTGDAAKLLGKLPSKWDEAARLGHRSLFSIAGQPIIAGAPVLGKMQDAGQALKNSTVGKEFQRLFTKYGDLNTDPIVGGTPEASDLIRLKEKTDQEMVALKRGTFDPLMEGVSMSGREGRDMSELMGKADRGDDGATEALQAYLEAHPAAKQWYSAQGEQKQAALKLMESLDNTGVAQFAGPDDVNFLPQIAKSDIEKAAQKVGNKIDLQGQSKNAINAKLAPASSLGIDPNTLGKVGRDEFYAMGGETGFLTKPLDEQKAFIKKNRQTAMELTNSAELKTKYVQDAKKRHDHYVDQVLGNVHSDTLMRNYVDEGIAVPWDDSLHAGKGFVKIDQGRWKSNPVALPQMVDQAVEVLTKNMMPERAGIFGAWANEALSWWKVGQLFTQPSYFSRNMVTGVLHNAVEGMDLVHPQTYRMYTEAEKMVVPEYLLRKGAPKSDGFVSLKLGDETYDLPRQRVWDEYFNRGMDGGGGFIGSTVKEDGVSRSSELRQKMFSPQIGFNQRLESGIRIPLMLKTVEDTLSAAKQSGMQLDEAMLTRAFTNAEDAVKRVHFDYSDLSPFEQRVKQLVPFYAWSRKNIPYETANLMQKPGKYAGYIRMYYQAWVNSGYTHDDAPPWIAEGYTLPWGESEDGNKKFIDFTSFLPVMDLAKLALAFRPGSQPGGKDMPARAIGWGLGQVNPFVSEVVEQGMSKDMFTGREFNSETPQEMFGIPMSSRTQHVLQLAPSAGIIDRLNPGDIFTKVGNKTGAVSGDRRPYRNEPSQGERFSRFVFGPKIYEEDKDRAGMSANERRKNLARYVSKARRAKTPAEREMYRKLADEARELLK